MNGIDLLDVDPAVLHRLKSVGELEQLARGELGIGEGAGFEEFHVVIVQASSGVVGPISCMNVTSAMGPACVETQNPEAGRE
jgi:hypothetical protein